MILIPAGRTKNHALPPSQILLYYQQKRAEGGMGFNPYESGYHVHRNQHIDFLIK